ncbi:hypothetical protein V8C86DRAFT_473754 [Haematococcus lacustris]
MALRAASPLIRVCLVWLRGIHNSMSLLRRAVHASRALLLWQVTMMEVSVAWLAPVSPSLPMLGWPTWWLWKAFILMNVGCRPSRCHRHYLRSLRLYSTPIHARLRPLQLKVFRSAGSCGNPYVMHPAFALGNRTFLPRASTCTTMDSSPCYYGSDYTFLVPASAFDRIVTLDTCPGRAAEAWDTVLFVFPATSDACDSCPVSPCGLFRPSRIRLW